MEDNFYRWVLKHAKAALAAPLPVALFYILKLVWPPIANRVGQSTAHLEAAFQFMHGIVAFVLFILISRYEPFLPNCGPLETDGKGNPKIHKAVTDSVHAFYRSWHYWWFVLVAIYFVLGMKALPGQSIPSYWWNGILNLLMNLSGAILLCCYIDLVPPEKNQKPDLRRIRVFLIFFGFATVCNILTSAYTAMHPANQWPVTVFMLLSGLANGAALALLVGRLGSVYIGVPGEILVFLYVYSVIQATYGLFNTKLFMPLADENITRTIISGIVLPLKVILFAVVSWAMNVGRLTTYFEAIPSSTDDAKKRWVEIRGRSEREALPVASAATATSQASPNTFNPSP